MDSEKYSLQNLFMQAPAAIVILNGPDFIIEFANEQLYKSWSRNAEIIGKPLLEVLPELKDQAFPALLRKVMETGEPYYCPEEKAVLLKDGKPVNVYYDYVYKPILETGKKASGVIVMANDITEQVLARKRAEENEVALRLARDESERQKRLYEAITRSTPDLIYVFDLNYRFIYANEALLTMWGLTWEQSKGKKLLEVGYEPWHAEMHEREIDHVVATQKSIRGEVSFPHATLGKRIYDYIFVPVINEKGQVEAVAGTTRDITEIKLAEEALKQNEEKLEKLVTERTRELQRSNEDLQQFAHVASHDLKEPVRKIIIFGSRMQEEFNDDLPPRAKGFLSKIEVAANRMTAMIDGVLLYSSLNAKEKEMEGVDLNDIINHIKTDLELVISQKNAEINYKKLPTIFGSALLIYQLFYNLLNNSLKFARPGVTPVINLDAELEKDGKFARIILQDNGIGFSPAQAEMIFKTFTRLHSKDEYEGTGLGLALCKKIAERHNGKITASGKVNEGATFIITLPLNEKSS
ncbi:hypothetical protein A4D02_05385 [Niastella koreensis]|nr:PAS domain-containing protein [Niastella koreensis]OQP48154.1 hypothetical protein A4D02_05385 [Niastella koreensis]